MTQQDLLSRLEADLRNVLAQVRQEVVPLEEAALRHRTKPEQWNALETFAHLNVFAEMYLPRIERAIHKGKANKWGQGHEVRYTMMGRRDVRRADPLNGKKYRTPKRYDFMDTSLELGVIKEFLILGERILRNIQLAQQVDLNRCKVPRGKSGFFNYNLGNVFEWLVFHSQRHISQILLISDL